MFLNVLLDIGDNNVGQHGDGCDGVMDWKTYMLVDWTRPKREEFILSKICAVPDGIYELVHQVGIYLPGCDADRI